MRGASVFGVGVTIKHNNFSICIYELILKLLPNMHRYSFEMAILCVPKTSLK